MHGQRTRWEGEHQAMGVSAVVLNGEVWCLNRGLGIWWA